MTKVCTKCKERKDQSLFGKNPKGRMGLCSWCNRCKTKNALAWNKRNPEKHNAHSYKNHFKVRYGLTLEDVQLLKDKQNNTCAICPSVGNLVIDHNHKTGKIRGMLCSSCNSGLGYFRDNEELLRKAAEYLVYDGI